MNEKKIFIKRWKDPIHLYYNLKNKNNNNNNNIYIKLVV